MRSTAWAFGVLVFATSGWGQQPYSVVGSADYSSGTTVGIPRGSIFTVVFLPPGPSLAGFPASVFAAPLPLVFDGVSVGLWTAPAGAGPAVAGTLLAQSPLLYVSPSQINAILPSSIAAGSYYLGVTGVSLVAGYPPVTFWLPVTVTDGRFAAFTRTARGFGPATALQYDPAGNLSLNGLATPAIRGDVISLYGTGLGALPSGLDADAPQAGTLRGDVTVYVAGTPVTPSYAGRAPGLPGVDQITFTLPPSVALRCFVPLQVQTGNARSGLVTLSVSIPGTVCGNDLALPQTVLASLDAGGKLRGVGLSFTSTTESPSGVVSQIASTEAGAWDESDLSILAGPGTALPLPLCTRSDQAVPTVAVLEAPGPTPNITGTTGCEWVNYYPGCVASGFSFGPELGGFSGALPPPLPTGEIVGLTASYVGQSLTASWSATPGPDDALSVAVNSSYTTPSLFGAFSSYTNTLSCDVAPTAEPFVFPAADAAWALQYQSQNVVLTLTNISHQTFALTGAPYDFLLVYVVNSVNAIYRGPF